MYAYCVKIFGGRDYNNCIGYESSLDLIVRQPQHRLCVVVRVSTFSVSSIKFDFRNQLLSQHACATSREECLIISSEIICTDLF